MITCKTCKKFAKLETAYKNGLGEILLIGSCKHCGYENEPKLPDNFTGKDIEILQKKVRIDYDDWEEIGFDD